MDGAGSVVGASVGMGVLILFALCIVAVFRSGVREQREVMSYQRVRRDPGRAERALGGFSDAEAYALRQKLLYGDIEATLSGGDLLATDGKLHGYEHVGVDWNDIWDAARRRSTGVPPFGVRPYWSRHGPSGSPAPHSVLAFWGASARLRIAQDPSTDGITLAMLAGIQDLTGTPTRSSGDPDPAVRAAAARRL